MRHRARASDEARRKGHRDEARGIAMKHQAAAREKRRRGDKRQRAMNLGSRQDSAEPHRISNVRGYCGGYWFPTAVALRVTCDFQIFWGFPLRVSPFE